MQLKNKTILLISPEPWAHLLVSKHHYAIHLAARGNQVYFLNPPSIINGLRIQKTDYSNLFTIDYNGFLKGLRFLPQPVQQLLIRRKFNQIQSSCGVSFDIVWSFDNSVFYDFNALPNEVYCISHIVDLNQDFNTQIAAETANLCLGVCLPIVSSLKRFNNKAYLIKHGLSSEFNPFVSFELPGTNKIKAFYAGNMDIKYIDWITFERMIISNENIDFYFAGKWENSGVKNKIISHKNAYYLGILPSVLLQQYYNRMDILLICYLYQLYPDQLTNSHKMMGYLASGKMIVATWTEEYQKLNKEGLILMAKNGHDFISNFEHTISNLKSWNSIENQNIRKAFAYDNTYDKQIERIEKIL